MGPLFGMIVVLAVAFVVLAVGWVLQARINRQSMLRRILDRIEGELAPVASPFSDRVSGVHHGREFRLHLGTRPKPFSFRASYPVTASVKLRHAPRIAIRIRRDRGLAAFQKKLGLVRDVDVAGGGPFDWKYLVEVSHAPAKAPLADETVRMAIITLLTRWDLDRVVISKGWLHARGSSERMGLNMLNDLLDSLEVLAHAYDRRPALEIGISEHFVWVGGADSAPRCPYCHDAIGDADELAACEGCNTVLHTECHQENNGCPILGCGHRSLDYIRPIPIKE